MEPRVPVPGKGDNGKNPHVLKTTPAGEQDMCSINDNCPSITGLGNVVKLHSQEKKNTIWGSSSLSGPRVYDPGSTTSPLVPWVSSLNSMGPSSSAEGL